MGGGGGGLVVVDLPEVDPVDVVPRLATAVDGDRGELDGPDASTTADATAPPTTTTARATSDKR